MVTIVLPIIYLNDYAHLAMKDLGEKKDIPSNIHFIFAVSSEEVKTELIGDLGNFAADYKIYVANNRSSNFLRGYAKLAETDFIYFSDCDDYPDFQIISELAAAAKDKSIVHCFNVTMTTVDEDMNELHHHQIFHLKEGVIEDIKDIPTCVYSKLIPTKYIKQIEFPNLPFSQDWAISYQLNLLAKHTFTDVSTYKYIWYSTNSSSRKHTKEYGLKRVFVMCRLLTKLYKSKGLLYERDFLAYRYAIMCSKRLNVIGKRGIPIPVTLRLMFTNFTPRFLCVVMYRSLYNLRYIFKI